MNANGNSGDDDFDDKPEREERPQRRDRPPRRGGQREFGAEPDFGGPPPGAGYGDRPPGGGYGDRAPGGGYGDRPPGGFRGGRGGFGGPREGGGGGRFGGPPREGGGGRFGGPREGGGRPYQPQEPTERGPRQNGTLKFFNADRGFGFIAPDDGGKDVFVHISAIERSGLPQLPEGTKLSFETEQDRRGRGPQAVNLQLAD